MPDSPRRLPARWARQREIILRSLARRLIFLAGLVVLALIIVLVRFWPL
jgi:type IV secretory pathway TrbD component